MTPKRVAKLVCCFMVGFNIGGYLPSGSSIYLLMFAAFLLLLLITHDDSSPPTPRY